MKKVLIRNYLLKNYKVKIKIDSQAKLINHIEPKKNKKKKNIKKIHKSKKKIKSQIKEKIYTRIKNRKIKIKNNLMNNRYKGKNDKNYNN